MERIKDFVPIAMVEVQTHGPQALRAKRYQVRML